MCPRHGTRPRAGLLTRSVCTDDARSRRIRLTPEGVALVDRLVAEHVADEHRLLSGLTDVERSRLASLEKWGRSDQLGT